MGTNVIHLHHITTNYLNNMDALEMIMERRSVRRFKDETVSRELLKEIVDISRWAPSWVNYQVARYTIVDNAETLKTIADNAVRGFTYNTKTLSRAKGLMVLSYVKGKSGKKEEMNQEFENTNTWEMFDAGIACQTFCLAAHAKGVGTCIMGVVNQEQIAQIISLPEDESVAAVIAYGYEDGEHAKATPRKSTEEILRIAE